MSYENLYNDLINESLYDGPNPSDKKKCTPKSNDELTQIAFSGSVKTEINEIVRSVIQNSLTPVFYTLNILNILRPGNNILEEDALYTTKPLNVPGSGNTKAAEAIPRVVGLDTIDIYPNYVSVNFRNCYVKNYFTYDFIIDPQTYTLKYRIKSAFNDSDGTDRSHAFIIQFGSFYDFTDYRRELRFNDTANYAAYIKNLKQSIKKIRSAIPVKLGTVDTNTQAPEFLKLYYLYKNIPTELLSEFDTELLQDDLLLLLSYDEAYRSFFSDSYFEKNINNQLKSKNAKDPSSALLKIIALLKLKNKLPELTEYLYKYPKLINRIYTNLNDEIVYNGETIPSRYLWVMIVEELIFTRFGETFKKDPIAVFDYMVRHSGGFFNEDKSYGNVDQNNNKTSKKATLKIVDDKIAIIQETTHYKISKDWINAGEDTVGELEYLTYSYFPHELIVIFNNGNPEIHTALYWYNLQQNKKQEELAKTLRIAGDLIALALGIYGYFEGGWLIVELSIADIIFSLEDIAITTFHDELEELLGKEFIATFDQFMEFYTLALAVIFTPLLITGFLRSVIRILAKLSPGALKVMTKFYKFIGSLVKKLPSGHPLKSIFSHDLEFWGKNMNKLDEISKNIGGNKIQQILDDGKKLSNEISNKIKNDLVIQKTNNLEQLYSEAEVASKELNKITTKFAEETNGVPGFREELKSKERAWEKINSDYAGDASRLVDIAGSKVVYETVEDVYIALKKFNSEYKILKIKDRIQQPFNGYRDILMNIEMKNGHIIEFRLHLKEMDEVADGIGHKLYEEVRSIEGKILSENRLPKLSEEKRISDLNKQMYDLYQEAWNKIINK